MPIRPFLPLDDGLPFECGACVLRRLTRTDLSTFQAYRSDPEVGKYQGWEPMDDIAAADFLQRMEHAEMFVPGVWQQLGIGKSEDGTLLGDIGICLSESGDQAELGITLDPTCQGKGIATTAFTAAIDLVFERTTAKRVVGITDAKNTRSILLLTRVGMQKVREYQTRFRGEACVEYEFSMGRP